MHAVQTPSRGPYDMHRGSDASGPSTITGRHEESSLSALDPAVARVRSSAQQHSSLGQSSGNGSAIRSRKSIAPDIGTPIKMASSSPYRTPESQSRTSLFLSRTPFGTPAKSSVTPSSSSALATSSTLTSTTNAPTKPITGLRAQTWALAKSLVDDNAYVSFALQSRSHLPYTSALSFVLRANWTKLSLTIFIALHMTLSIASIRPLHPVQSITIPIQPVTMILSALAFTLIVSIIVLSSGHPFSLFDKKWDSTTQEDGIRDERFAGVSLAAGSPANLIAKAMKTRALWRGVFLYSIAGFILAVGLALCLTYNGAQDWTPYINVPVRLSQGYRSTAIRPNERFFFLLASNTFLAGTYAFVRYVYSIKSAQGGLPAPFSVPRFDGQAIFERASTRLVKAIKLSMSRTLIMGGSAPVLLLQAYLLVRRPLFRLILSFIGYHSSIRSMIIPSFKRPLLSVDLVLRSTSLAMATVMFLETVSIAWEVYATQPVSSASGAISKFSREPTKSLIRAMQIRTGTPSAEEAHLTTVQRKYLAHFAFAELATSVATDAERRKAIFRDIESTSTASSGTLATAPDRSGRSAWVSIAQECIVVLQEQRGCIQRRGRPPPASTASVAAAGQTSTGQFRAEDPAHRIALAGATDAIKTNKPSFWDRLASKPMSSASALAASPPSVASTAATSSVEGLGSILHRIAPPPTLESSSAAASRTAPSTSSAAAGQQSQSITTLDLIVRAVAFSTSSVGMLIQALPSDLQHVLRNSYIVRKGFALHSWLFSSSDQTLLMAGIAPSDAALATWAVQTLSALLSASLDQDEYGTVALATSVNLGVDNVLEEFALLLLALQSWTQSVVRPSKSDQEHAGQVNGLVINYIDLTIAPLIATLRSSITLVTGAFEPTGLRLRDSTRAKVDQALLATKVSE